MTKKKVAQILVPSVMLTVVLGIWLLGSQKDIASASESVDLLATSVDVDDLTSHNLPVIIDFGADECVPCVEMAPVLVKLNNEMQGKAVIKFVDVWKTPEAATGFPVQVIPTQVFINADGTPYVPEGEIGVQLLKYVDPDTEEHLFTVHQGGLTEDQMLSILTDMGVS